MKKRVVLIIGLVLLCVAVLIFIYPTASKLVNRINDDSLARQYNNQISAISTEEKEKYLSEARKYNENLNNTVADVFSEDAFNVNPSYEDILSFDNGQIGVIEIPKINVKLPIYHGISDDVLKIGAAHIANTAFPVGGINTNSVISAHTAFPGKEFFDKLTELEEGDTFSVTVLDNKLTYKVSDIYVVEPGDVSKLKIVPGKDLVTLVTCTPYAINTHRLLVRGERYTEIKSDVIDDESISSTNICYLVLVVYALLFLTVIVLIFTIIRKMHGKKVRESLDDKKNKS